MRSANRDKSVRLTAYETCGPERRRYNVCRFAREIINAPPTVSRGEWGAARQWGARLWRAGWRGRGVQSIIIRSNGGGGGTTRRTNGQIHNGSRAGTPCAQPPDPRPDTAPMRARGGSAGRRRKRRRRRRAAQCASPRDRRLPQSIPPRRPAAAATGAWRSRRGREPRPSCAVGHRRWRRRQLVSRKGTISRT